MSATLAIVLLTTSDTPMIHRIEGEDILFFTHFPVREYTGLTKISLLIDDDDVFDFAASYNDYKKIYEVDCALADCEYIYKQGTSGTKRVSFYFFGDEDEKIAEITFKNERYFRPAAVAIIISVVIAIFAVILVIVLVSKFVKKPLHSAYYHYPIELMVVKEDSEEIVPAISIRQSLQLERTDPSLNLMQPVVGRGAGDFSTGGRCIRQSLDIRRHMHFDEPSGSSRNYVSEYFQNPHTSDKNAFGDVAILMTGKRHANERIPPTIAQMTLQDYERANSTLEENIQMQKPISKERVRHIEDLEAIPEVSKNSAE